MDCVFCKIAAKEIPAEIRYEDEACIAFDDLHPDAPTHVLIIPKRHIASVRELTTTDGVIVGHLILAARTIAEGAGIAENGYRLVVNCGRDGGQIVPHLHMHLLGGKLLGKNV